MGRVLVFGFEPFGGLPDNPSRRLVEALALLPATDLRVTTTVLPVAFELIPGRLDETLVQGDFDAIVGFGVWTGSAAIRLEAFALNTVEHAAGDGWEPPVVIDSTQPAAFLTSLPLDSIATTLRSHGIPATVSHDPGSFACNYAYFYAARRAAERGVPALFVHVPLTTDLAVAMASRYPSLPFDTLLEAARLVLVAVGKSRSDGAVHVASK